MGGVVLLIIVVAVVVVVLVVVGPVAGGVNRGCDGKSPCSVVVGMGGVGEMRPTLVMVELEVCSSVVRYVVETIMIMTMTIRVSKRE